MVKGSEQRQAANGVVNDLDWLVVEDMVSGWSLGVAI